MSSGGSPKKPGSSAGSADEKNRNWMRKLKLDEKNEI